MRYEQLDIPDVVLLTPEIFSDERGFFYESFRQNDFEHHCGHYTFVQDNHSRSSQGVLRGLHYQLQHPQGKLVRVTQGSVFDVAVDIRRQSDTFGQWVGRTLDAESKQQLWIPPGFAHGFYVLSDRAEFQYKCTAYYAPEDQHCIAWNDPYLAIKWPIASDHRVIVSEKDKQGKAWQS